MELFIKKHKRIANFVVAILIACNTLSAYGMNNPHGANGANGTNGTNNVTKGKLCTAYNFVKNSVKKSKNKIYNLCKATKNKMLHMVGKAPKKEIILPKSPTFLEKTKATAKKLWKKKPVKIGVASAGAIAAAAAITAAVFGAMKLYKVIRAKLQKAKKRKIIKIERKPEQEVINEQDEKECLVCYDDKHKDNFHRLQCGHEFCKNCLCELIETAINENKGFGSSQNLKCPQCKENIEDQDIRELTDHNREVLERIANIKTRETLEKLPGYKHCQTPDCEFYWINENGHRQEIDCRQCGARFCSSCCHPHSMQMSCKDAEIDRKSDGNMSAKDRKANQKWLKKNTKQCPDCKRFVQKNRGCNHMTCKCGAQFCWICGESYRTHRLPRPCLTPSVRNRIGVLW